ncbi:hypothetical protein FNH22_13350 [Fulvivirga sp. M361]|uniref:hypothetical protein n=1 Tax=Fulvivirga sp. M361 TaxID=2594266 RepID=UPI001179D445|nr:hypothetical protein [Fulvivirga sp. M361]TRX58855.1 hypothetical protein FNH22_13350 [Fulvivirga sp. M361]
MKTPTWAIVVGICLMLFGGCSVTKNIQAINMPEMLEMQQDMMEKMSGYKGENSFDSLSTTSGSNIYEAPDAEMFKNMTEGMQKVFAVSDFTKTWTVRFGYIGLLVAILYVLSGVFLLIKKEFSIKLVYLALVTSIVFSVIQSFVLALDPAGGLMAMSAGFGNIFGIMIDIILIIVVVTIDKSTYFNNAEKTV